MKVFSADYGFPSKKIDLGSDRILFCVGEDNRTMFEVRAGDDGKSIEVRAVDICKVDGLRYDTRLTVEPNVTNSITVRTKEYE